VGKPTPFAVSKGRIFNTAFNADTNFFSSDLAPSDVVSDNEASTAFRITVCLDTGSKLKVTLNDGNSTVIGEFNSGNKLSANAVYTFVHEVRDEDTVNYQIGTSATVLFFYVSEVRREAL